MEHLRALLTGSGPAAAVLPATPAPSGEAAAHITPFSEALFETAAPSGGPSQATVLGGDLLPDREGQEYAQEDSIPASDLSFGDFLDVINPLHHIPIVGNIYRGLTGDTISGPARVAGATLYGGPVGMLAGIVNAISEEISGDDIGGTLIASILGEDPPEETLIAEASQAAPAAEASQAPAVEITPAAARAGPVLTGDAALSALLGDLRAAPDYPMELPGLAPAFRAPAMAVPERGAGAPAAEARPLRASAEAARGFSGRMFLGMDKYRALAEERGGPGRPALEQADRRL